MNFTCCWGWLCNLGITSDCSSVSNYLIIGCYCCFFELCDILFGSLMVTSELIICGERNTYGSSLNWTVRVVLALTNTALAVACVIWLLKLPGGDFSSNNGGIEFNYLFGWIIASANLSLFFFLRISLAIILSSFNNSVITVLNPSIISSGYSLSGAFEGSLSILII